MFNVPPPNVMNPEQPSREQIEARLTALLLNELPEDEAALLRWTLSQDPELSQLHDRLKTTIGLVRETVAHPAEAPVEKTAVRRLSEERRRRLLEHFKTPRPTRSPLFWLKRIEVRPLVGVLAVVALLAVLGAMFLPALASAKRKAQNINIVNNLKQLDLAKKEWAADNNKSGDAVVTMDDLKPYLGNEFPRSIAGEKYEVGKVSEPAKADIDASKAKQIGSLASRLPSGGAAGGVFQLSSDGTVTALDEGKQYKANVVGYVDQNQRLAKSAPAPAAGGPFVHAAVGTAAVQPDMVPQVTVTAGVNNTSGGGTIHYVPAVPPPAEIFLPKTEQQLAEADKELPPVNRIAIFGAGNLNLQRGGAVGTALLTPLPDQSSVSFNTEGSEVAGRQPARRKLNIINESDSTVAAGKTTEAAKSATSGEVYFNKFDGTAASQGTPVQSQPVAPVDGTRYLAARRSQSGTLDIAKGEPSSEALGNFGSTPPPVTVGPPPPAASTAFSGAVYAPTPNNAQPPAVPGASPSTAEPQRYYRVLGEGDTGAARHDENGNGGVVQQGVGTATVLGNAVVGYQFGQAVGGIGGTVSGPAVSGNDLAYAGNENAGGVGGRLGARGGRGGGAGGGFGGGGFGGGAGGFGGGGIGGGGGGFGGGAIASGGGRGARGGRGRGAAPASAALAPEVAAGNGTPTETQPTAPAPRFDYPEGDEMNGNVMANKGINGALSSSPGAPASERETQMNATDLGSVVAGYQAGNLSGPVPTSGLEKTAASGYVDKAAQISVDPNTHKIVVVGDAVTAKQIQNTLSQLDREQQAEPNAPGSDNGEQFAFESDKMPTLGDMPVMGKLFQQQQENAKAAPAPGVERKHSADVKDTVTFNNANTFVGGTVVNGGTLVMNNSGTIQSDRDQDVDVFVISGTNAVANPVAQEFQSIFNSKTRSSGQQSSPLYQRVQSTIQNSTVSANSGINPGFTNVSGSSSTVPAAVDERKKLVTESKPADSAGLSFNFQNAPAREVLNYLADTAGVIVSQNTPVSGTVTIKGNNLTRQEAVEALNAQLSKNDEVVLLDGRTLTVMSKQYAKTADIPVKIGNNPTAIPPSNAMVTETFPIRFADAGQLVKKLAVSASPQATIEANAAGNSIVITDTPQNVHHLSQMIDSLDVPPRPAVSQAPIPQPEFLTRENAFSTFSMNVSDVSFKLAQASLQKGQMPDAASIRSEEFINAFNYRDPEAAAGQPMAFAYGRARDPFALNRDFLRFSIRTAAAGREAGRPLNLVLLLDTSGSMERADRVAIIREALRVLAAELKPRDIVSVVTFARTAHLWADGVPGDQAGETLKKVGGITPEGGTNLEEAMKLAYETALRHYLANGGNRVVLLTDGAANLGNVNPAVLKQKVEAERRQGIALDCFGIGWDDFNDDLLAQLSGNGDGRYAFLNSPDDVTNDFAAKLAGALQVAAQDVKVQVEFNPRRVTAWRQIGYATHQLTKEQFRDNSVLAAEIAAQEAGNALYTVETKPDGSGPIATVYVRYRVPGTQIVHERSWAVEYDGIPPALDQAGPAMRLAAVAAEFSEWLASSPFAQEVTTDELLKDLSGVPQIYGADRRPAQLETMIREARSLAGQTMPMSQPALSGAGR
jgi:Mg-chelatase subunit ChlD/type II secretory pathway pseudopilin PulG